MKVSFALPRILWQLPLLFLLLAQAGAQAIQSLESIKSQAELDRTGAALDAALFDSFNHCDLEKFGKFLTENVEFYDDRDGLSVGRQRQIEDLKNYICGKVTREIVPGTLQVYRLEGYGAMEVAFTVSTIRGTTTRSRWAKGNLFICGNTKMARGKSHGSSVMTTTPSQSDGLL